MLEACGTVVSKEYLPCPQEILDAEDKRVK